MLRSTRAALAVGLGCLGVAGLVGQSVAQQGDPKVKQVAAANTGTGATAPVAMPPVSIGSIDIEGVFREYYKVAFLGEALNAEVQIRYNELTKIANEGKLEQEKLGHITAGTADARACEAKMLQLKAQIEAGRQSAEREFTQKETEMMTQVYNEVCEMAKAVAKQRGMTFIVKYADGKVSGSEPNTAMAAMSRTIIYADPAVDITKTTIQWLNYRYRETGGKMPKGPAAGAGTAPAGSGAAPAARPATNPAAAPGGR